MLLLFLILGYRGSRSRDSYSSSSSNTSSNKGISFNDIKVDDRRVGA